MFLVRGARRVPPAAAVRACAAAVVAAWPMAALPQASPGFTLCVAPQPPGCALADKAVASCDADMEAYVARVFRYRECLARESERAVAQSNDVIDDWRCKRFAERCRR
ncbi:hypothetical protein [Methylosinus sp. Sm6]|uniref:hypothetical protein n=1 Tax=Methylosinus sp. Sm6 TaxID=2866948 RepID=UPI001C9938D7|nr:hypothetical protein [Methylosinus sp. Sm6]MBY6242951.1 hypothetical protein [Methylosinus sp. Sm6]